MSSLLIKKSPCCFENLRETRIRIIWEITSMCNSNCVYCSLGENNIGDLDTANLLLIAEQIVNSDVWGVLLSGREPLMRKDVVEIIRYMRERSNIEIAISTNGSLLDKRTTESLCKLGVSTLNFSIDSSDPETHDFLRDLGNSHKRAIDAINFALNYGLNVKVNICVTKINNTQVIPTLDLLRSLGVRNISVSNLMPVGKARVNTSLILNASEFTNIALSVRQWVRNFPDLRVSLINNYNNLLFECPGGQYLYAILPDGSASICNILAHSDSRFVTKQKIPTKDIDSVFSEARRLRDSLITKQVVEFCGNCKQKQTCKGGCKAVVACSTFVQNLSQSALV